MLKKVSKVIDILLIIIKTVLLLALYTEFQLLNPETLHIIAEALSILQMLIKADKRAD